MNKKSVLRTLLIATVFAMLMSVGALANTWGPALKAASSWQKVDVENATDNTILHKLVIPRDGVMYFSGVEYSSYSNNMYGLSFSLLKSNYVPINRYGSSSTYVNGTDQNSSSYVREYALKKGTYYLRVTNTKNYRIIGKFKAVNDQGNTVKKKKGTKIGKKKTMTALFGAGDTYNKTEWFKFKLKKPKKVTLVMGAYGDASYRVTFYGPKPFKKGDTTYVSSGYTRPVKYWIQRGSKKLKLKKGTYYIKIQRTSNDVSGYCSIMWK